MQFGYFWAYCKYKWINKRACQQVAIDFKTIPSECERHQMSFRWWEKHELVLLPIGFLAYWIFNIIGSLFFSLAEILTNLKRCHLQIQNLIIVDIYEQNWLDDLRISCKSPYKLVKFIKIDGNLKEELKEFEGAFEERWSCWITKIKIKF